MLTDKAIEKLAVEAKKTKAIKQKGDNDDKRGFGRLVIRAYPNGTVRFWFRYIQDEKRVFVELGVYDNKSKQGLSLAQARQKSQQLVAARLESENGNLKAHLQQTEKQKKEAEKRARKEIDDVQTRNKEATLRKLLEAYVDHLRRQNKYSTNDVKNLFNKNVFKAWPELSEKLACEVQVSEITDVLRKMINDGIGRNTAKLRSYIRAAYTLAMQSTNDPTVPASAHIFNVTSNPAASIPALSQFSRARDRTLDINELKHYLNRVEQIPSLITRSLLLSAIYLGGQRPSQLARVKIENVDIAASTVLLFDPKGKRSSGPRQHRLPMTNTVISIFKPLLRLQNDNGYLFTSNGKALIRPETLSVAIKDICDQMIEGGEARTSFQMRDIRRTCETMLAAMGVTMEVRAQLQSHGLGGIQNRHYDRHMYMDEKRAALEVWEEKLKGLQNHCQST